ncbi:MAG: TetR/AcrR family transcriptional regulator [Mycobacterium sp.]
MPDSIVPSQPSSLRAQQVAQTRDSLLGAGRQLFGEKGFRDTSVEDLAHAARVTTGALYHHFPTKTALFEAVFEDAHREVMAASAQASRGASDDLDELARGFEAFLDAVLQPELQRILVLDGPAVLGLARYTELDERYAFAVIIAALRAATDAGTLRIDDPETVTRLLLGALTRGAMLIANSPNPVETRHSVAQSMRVLLGSFVPRRP